MAILTVKELKDHLNLFPDNARAVIMPEDGEPFEIERIIHYPNDKGYPEAWIVFSEFYEEEDEEVNITPTVKVEDAKPVVELDVVKIRGSLRQA